MGAAFGQCPHKHVYNANMKLAPQTRYAEIVDDLNAYLARDVYADAGSWEMRSLKRECERVRDIDAFEGWALLGSYYALVGNLAETERCFNASIALRADAMIYGNYYASLSNLGYFTKSHQFLVENGAPEFGRLSALNNYARRLGSFKTAVSFNEKADAMGLVLHESLPDEYFHAARILKQNNFTDEQVNRHLDAAGEVLRRHALFYHDQIRIDVTDMEGVFVGVTCILDISKNPKEVLELNIELAKVEEEMDVERHPVFDVVFNPV